MNNRKYILKQTMFMLLGELLCSGLMVAVFALLGYYDISVLLGAAAGSLIATANHFVLMLGVLGASAKAENQDVKGGQALIQMSYMARLLGMGLILILCAKSGIFHLVALVIPLVFTRPILTITELINKKGGNNL